MTILGPFIRKKSINKAGVSIRTGISTSILSELTLNSSTKLRADEFDLIAIDIPPCEILDTLCSHLILQY